MTLRTRAALVLLVLAPAPAFAGDESLSAGTHVRRWVSAAEERIWVKAYADADAHVRAVFAPIDPEDHGNVIGAVASSCELELDDQGRHSGFCPPLPVGHYRAAVFIENGGPLAVETYRLVVIPRDGHYYKVRKKVRRQGEKIWAYMRKRLP